MNKFCTIQLVIINMLIENNIKLCLSSKIDFLILKLLINNDGSINTADSAKAEGKKNTPILKKVLSLFVKL